MSKYTTNIRFSIIACLLAFSLHSINAQRSCGQMQGLAQELQDNPALKQQLEEIEKHTQFYSKSNAKKRVEGIITIPVVVHVVYNHAGENISDAQIQTQLDVLNEDFRRLNTDKDNLWPQATDAEIEFCLATRDPDGDATCGIIRTYTDSTKFYSKFSMKSTATGGANPWPYQDYLNMWVCDISGLLGFARFPGYSDPELWDGVVTDYRAFGTIGDLKTDFALGRTTTHEIGHWLNLRHIWGDGDCFDDDFVSDTPNSDDHNYGCDIGHISCGSVDMVQNYMDYSDDVCMNLFTIGQKNRMRALFEPGGFRESLLESKGCQGPILGSRVTLTIAFDAYPNDISWEIRDANGLLLHSDTGFSNSEYEDETIYYEFEYPDGDYTFAIFDSYGDGLCCNEGDGRYWIDSPYGNIHTATGTFGSGESVPFALEDGVYRFKGPGTNWDFAGNWNKGKVPSPCYEGEIIIEDECLTNGAFELDAVNDLIVKSGAKLTIN